jgi:hypothetical protein
MWTSAWLFVGSRCAADDACAAPGVSVMTNGVRTSDSRDPVQLGGVDDPEAVDAGTQAS